MKTIIKPITREGSPFHVVLLHKALGALGLPPASQEAQRREAGDDTRKKVRELQKRLCVAADESQLLDQATCAAIAVELRARGLTAASRAFTVRGAVRQPCGAVQRRQRLLAFDLDLRAVAVYQTAETLADLERAGGFEFLGEAFSDARGAYQITFYDWQCRRAERKTADVVVYAVDGAGAKARLIGRSRMVDFADYSEKGFVHGLDVTISVVEERTEYQTLMSALGAFLQESQVTLAQVARSADQRTFIAKELDLEAERLELAARAELLRGTQQLSHELLYGLGRQGVLLDWPALYKRQEQDLKGALAAAARARIIAEPSQEEISAFLEALRARAIQEALAGSSGEPLSALGEMLATALPEEAQRTSFLAALRSFAGNDVGAFWKEHLPSQPAFEQSPELTQRLLVTQQLTALTGLHQPLVHELQVEQGLGSIEDLMRLEEPGWIAAIEKAGVPETFAASSDEGERVRAYAGVLQSTLDATFPTRRIASMIERQRLPLPDGLSEPIMSFLVAHEDFDFAASRVDDFRAQLSDHGGERAAEMRSELLKLQRVFQVSVKADLMPRLLELGLHSAYSIANIPKKAFIATYAGALGGEVLARATYERAAHIAARTELAAIRVMEITEVGAPAYALSEGERSAALAVLQEQAANWEHLFGSPDLCECRHCRSVYSAAAYFVDLLRFLQRGATNAGGRTPLDMLEARRPDLLHLPLTCENTNTIIPYIDLAMEVMERYTVAGDLSGYRGHDTADATAEELRANPQHLDLEAYRRLKDARYPFSLPYHQPLDVIRIYGDHLEVSRDAVMRATNPDPSAPTAAAMAAETLRMSEEEYRIITREAFDGAPDPTSLPGAYGYAASGDLEQLSAVRELLRRSGLAYAELVELISTRFVNPHQARLDFLERLFSHASIPSTDLYERLRRIESGALDLAADPEISAALSATNAAEGTSVSLAQLGEFVAAHLAEVRGVITLYEPESRCDLDTTRLRTIESIYEGGATSGVPQDTWSRVHRFVRLSRRLGWSLRDTDLLLSALGGGDITGATIAHLAAATRLGRDLELLPPQLAVLWGEIDSNGKASLYARLFLNKAVQRIDNAFEPTPQGAYLVDSAQTLKAHRPAILAAFRLREEDLGAILRVAELTEAGVRRKLDEASDALSLPNLSTIYRYAVLARALKLRPPELCKLVELFDVAPFSIWNLDLETWEQIDPSATLAFVELVGRTKRGGFKADELEYILRGTAPADRQMTLEPSRALRTARAVRTALREIEQTHPDVLTPLALETLVAKLGLTFQPEIVARFRSILEGSARFETTTERNLTLVIPTALVDRFTYTRASGRLTASGVMTDAERAALKALAGATARFQAAVDELYEAPQRFLAAHMSGFLTDLTEANAVLLDHPAQDPASSLADRLRYVHQRFIPVLKHELRRQALIRELALLIDATEEATSVIVGAEADRLIDDLFAEGLSGTYYGDPAWDALAMTRVDEVVDFAWGSAGPGEPVPPSDYSVRWQAYLDAPTTGEYTLVVDVAGADETLELSVNDAVVVAKPSGDARTSWEAVQRLEAGRLHKVQLDYANRSAEATVRLRWKTATTALELIGSASAFPATRIDRFVERAAVYHRAAKLAASFELNELELEHLSTHRTDFGGLDLRAPTAEQWRRLAAYTELRSAIPQARARLIEVFAAASRASPAPSLEELKALIHQATAWDRADLDFFIDTHFSLGVSAFANEAALTRLRAVMTIAQKTGLSGETIAAWGAPQIDFDALAATAQWMKTTVKAKYDNDDWLSLAPELSDKLRAHQRDALIAYLLTRPEIRTWGAQDADGLFEYFLIDVQMGACMDTSRIVQANASVQMFVNRCLLNLESDLTTGLEKGVSPSAIDRDRWAWMKSYRVWEANRKTFLYPENWLEPEWRHDRSELFRALESHLIQNDITHRTVEEAFRNYLTGLNELANLEVCGMHREDDPDGRLRFLHVFARTQNAPYQFYYRRWNAHRKWSTWEKVSVDIRSIEAGKSSGVHLVPALWKGRLFLFWPEFREVQESPENSNQSVEQVAGEKMSELQPRKHWEVRLAWSEMIDGKWAPKQVSKETFAQFPDEELQAEQELLFTVAVTEAQHLRIEMSDRHYNLYRGVFELADITAPVQTFNPRGSFGEEPARDYRYTFNKRAASGSLELAGDVYLNAYVKHELLPVDSMKGADVTLDHPLFYCDSERTYFLRPVEVDIVDRIRHPELFMPLLPGLVDPWKHRIPALPSDLVWRLAEDSPAPLPDEVGVEYIDGHRAFHLSRETMTSMPNAAGAPRPITPLALRAGEEARAETEALEVLASSRTIGRAFGGLGPSLFCWPTWVAPQDMGLEFHTFHHPVSSQYVERMNQEGLEGLLRADLEIASDEGGTFEETYRPSFDHGLVQRPTDFASRTYYKENVCFDVYGANSSYNWELFFHAPLYIATRLSRNGQYEDAMRWFHFIFDPTTDAPVAPGDSETSRYWQVAPFKKTHSESLEDWLRALEPNSDPHTENATIAEWRDHPFDPHRVASNRPLAYMKHVVLKYVENLIAWGDSLFRRDTMESVNQALQLYVMASHILGPRPQVVPERGQRAAESFASLRSKLDDFSNALVELENVFPYSSDASIASESPGTSLLGVGQALYFCVPPNDKLLERWDTVEDRLYKIRHCQNIHGVERRLALFAPPIDPGALIAAASKGLSLSSVLAELSSPPANYRFTFLIQKASAFCNDVKVLGAALLGALEKRDGEELSRMRATHEVQLLDLTTQVRERQVLDARARREGLLKSRRAAEHRLDHYVSLLGRDDYSAPSEPSLPADLTIDSDLPPDTTLTPLQTDVDVALVESGESGLGLIPKEKTELDKSEASKWTTMASGVAETLAGVFSLIPQIDAEGTPFGVGAGAWWGGQNLGAGTSAIARALATAGTFLGHEAAQAGRLAAHIRREQEWTFQANAAAKEIIQLDKQVTSADIQVQVAEKELERHQQQVENAKTVALFLQDKFSNQELYQWMKEQLIGLFKQSYNLAYAMAKQAEKAYQYELGLEQSSFVHYGYWENAQQGLMSGERLQLALRQLEKAYLEDNRRELEISKHVSLATVDPDALVQLRETGKCWFSVPEELFDLDFRGHYFRRIASVRLTIPCVTGPYTSLGCSLRLLNNSIRVNTSMNSAGAYPHERDTGLLVDDDRFRTSYVPVTAIATSTAQNDAGLFELSFRDERYLPFEGAGAISTWELELSTEAELRTFDYSTITDVILHIAYTAREAGGLFKQKAAEHLKGWIENSSDATEQPLVQMLSMRHDFPSEWYRFLHPASEEDEQLLSFVVGKTRLLFLAQGRDVVVTQIDALARCQRPGDYQLVLTYTRDDGDEVTSSPPITMAPSTRYGGLRRASIGTTDASLNLEELEIDAAMTLRVKHQTAPDYRSLTTGPDEVKDIVLLIHYKLS